MNPKAPDEASGAPRVLLILLRLLLGLRLRDWHTGPAGIGHGWLAGLLLLHLQLTLLHLLQHLLWSLRAGLVGSGRGLFGFGCALILILLCALIGRIGIGCVGGYLGRRGSVGASAGGLRIRVIGAGLGHQDHAHELAGIVWRSQQNLVEAGTIQQFGDNFTRGAGTEAGNDSLIGGGGDFDIGGGVLAHAAQDVG